MTVRHRHVFYIPGFDPRGILFYYPLYRNEAARQAAINGMKIKVGERQRLSDISYSWQIEAEEKGQQTITCYEFLAWDDIVRAHWPKHSWQLLWETLYVIRAYLLTGAYFRMGQTAWPSLLTGSYPVLFIITSLFTALGAGYCTWYFSSIVLGNLPVSLPSIAIILILLNLSQRLGKRRNIFWLLHNYAFAARWGISGIPALEERLDAFAERIINTSTNSDYDEIMVVGHSFGTVLTIPILARVIAKPEFTSKLTLLTLGEVIPMISFLPQAKSYRAALKYVAESPAVIWKDFTSPVDGACFALTNPVTASGITLTHGTGPEILSARFHTLFHPQHYRRIRRNWYRIHFQYIMSFDLPGLFDYFAMTAGAKCITSRSYKTSKCKASIS